MKVIIDGYNLIWAVPELREKVLKTRAEGINLEEGRKALLHFLDSYQRGHPKLDITVVFDAKEEVFPYPSSSQKIRVLYSKEETADSAIKRIVEDEKKPQETLVVTLDKELKGKVKEKGAQVIGSLNFFKRISPAKIALLTNQAIFSSNLESPNQHLRHSQKRIYHKELSGQQEDLIKEELKRAYKIE